MVTFGTATCRRSFPERERADAERSEPRRRGGFDVLGEQLLAAKVTFAVRAEDRFSARSATMSRMVLGGRV